MTGGRLCARASSVAPESIVTLPLKLALLPVSTRVPSRTVTASGAPLLCPMEPVNVQVPPPDLLSDWKFLTTPRRESESLGEGASRFSTFVPPPPSRLPVMTECVFSVTLSLPP